MYNKRARISLFLGILPKISMSSFPHY
uniref:Uncharacterized protein n=1 Tax=Arundo donax TaxID=35708 RepID=A0A0A9HIX3_ARUDO